MILKVSGDNFILPGDYTSIFAIVVVYILYS